MKYVQIPPVCTSLLTYHQYYQRCQGKHQERCCLARSHYGLFNRSFWHHYRHSFSYLQVPTLYTWYDFLCIDTSNFIKTKTDWVEFCKSINIASSDDYFEKCKIYNKLPIMPEEYYIGFTSVSNELDLLEDSRRF